MFLNVEKQHEKIILKERLSDNLCSIFYSVENLPVMWQVNFLFFFFKLVPILSCREMNKLFFL